MSVRCAWLALVLCSAGCAGVPLVSAGPRAGGGGFVQRRGICLVRDGRRVRFVGSNAFALQSDAVAGSRGDAAAEQRFERTFAAAERAHANLLRVAGFHSGDRDPASIEIHPGVFAEPGLRGLDRVVAEASRRGIGLIIVLQNYWDDYGGVATQLFWRTGQAIASADDRGRFFEDPVMLAGARAYATMLAARRNTLTGLRYADDPTVVAWEVMNEPRGDGLSDDGEALAVYVGGVARALKDAAPRQLVLVGDEGFDSNVAGFDSTYWSSVTLGGPIVARRHESFERMLMDPSIDAGTVHFYPEVWGVRRGDERAAGVQWIREHARVARRMGKPLLVEEFGLRDGSTATAALSEGARRAAFDAWFAAARAEPAIAAMMPWGLEPAQGVSRDGFGWGSLDANADPFVDLLRRWSAAFDADRDTNACEDGDGR